MSDVAAPRRASATAWLAPFPPIARLVPRPSTVSPRAGSWSTWRNRSTLTLPTTQARKGRGDGPSILTDGSSQIAGRATDTEWQSECDDWMLFRRPGEAEDARVARLARAPAVRVVQCGEPSGSPARDGPPRQSSRRRVASAMTRSSRAATQRTAGADARAVSTASPSESAEQRGQPQHPQPADDPRADRRRVLADPAGEDQAVEARRVRWRPPQSLEQRAARTAQRRVPRRCRLPRRDRAVRACRRSPPRRAGRTRARAHPQGRRSRPRRGGAAAGSQGRPSPIESPSSAPRVVSCPSRSRPTGCLRPR